MEQVWSVPPAQNGGRRRLVPVPDRHPLLAGAQEMFENARPDSFLSLGFMRPHKRKLPDIFVTKDALPRALEAANTVYLHLERRAYPVTLASRQQFRRCIPDGDHRRHECWLDDWALATPTIVHVRKVAFGLRLFETTKEVETVWVNGRRVPSESLPLHRRRRYGVPNTSTVPSGLLALAAYFPLPGYFVAQAVG